MAGAVMADFGLSGQVALVTGASGDLGRHFASVLAEAGAAVVLMARRGDLVAAEAEALRARGLKASAVTGDITLPKGINAAFAAAENEVGPISLLINNAGISLTTPSIDLPDSDWDAVIDTNLKGAWLASQEAARRWVAAKRPGNIINIASILGQRVASQSLPYAVSKAGLIQMTRALSLEWARHNIRVNALAPGYIRTALNDEFFGTEAGAALIKRIPQRRLGTPQDLDGPLLLLASDASRYMTGTVLTVDGGHLNSSL
jgi:NAD(P)-dependent dehydrogenase (short-subunit alcohol dehydrogenase family)